MFRTLLWRWSRADEEISRLRKEMLGLADAHRRLETRCGIAGHPPNIRETQFGWYVCTAGGMLYLWRDGFMHSTVGWDDPLGGYFPSRVEAWAAWQEWEEVYRDRVRDRIEGDGFPYELGKAVNRILKDAK